MDIRHLQCFIAVAENLSFTKAAASLYLTQPALSHQIAELERELCIKLFKRDRRAVNLTDAGEALLCKARAIVNKANEFSQSVQNIHSGKTGRLSVGFLGTTERCFLPWLIARFRQKYPSIALNIYLLSVGAMDIALETGEIDVGITFVDKLCNFPHKSIYSDNLCLVLPDGHPLANFKQLDFTRLPNEIVFFSNKNLSPRGFQNLLRVSGLHHVSPDIWPVQNWGTLLLSIEAKMGISVLPRPIPTAYASPLLRIVPLEGDDLEVDLAAAWSKRNSNPTVPLFLDELEYILAKSNLSASSPLPENNIFACYFGHPLKTTRTHLYQ